MSILPRYNTVTLFVTLLLLSTSGSAEDGSEVNSMDTLSADAYFAQAIAEENIENALPSLDFGGYRGVEWDAALVSGAIDADNNSIQLDGIELTTIPQVNVQNEMIGVRLAMIGETGAKESITLREVLIRQYGPPTHHPAEVRNDDKQRLEWYGPATILSFVVDGGSTYVEYRKNESRY